MSENKKKKETLKTIVIVVLTVIIILVGIFGTIAIIVDRVDNPFIYIDVSFEGINGEGLVKISRKETKKVDLDNIVFTIGEHGNLKNGDEIVIVASSPKYWFKNISQTYTVKDLVSVADETLKLDTFNSDVLDTTSKDYLVDVLKKDIGDVVEQDDMELNDYYIINDGIHNKLYAIYSLDFEIDDCEFEKCAVVCYKDFIVTNGEFSYTFICHPDYKIELIDEEKQELASENDEEYVPQKMIGFNSYDGAIEYIKLVNDVRDLNKIS